MMDLKNYITSENIYFLTETTKAQAIEELFDHISPRLAAEDREEILQKIFYREKVMSTGVGIEVGVPHIRCQEIKEPIVAIGIQKMGIPDYETVDQSTVKIIILILLKENQHREHIKLLSSFITILKNETVRSQILNSDNLKEIYHFFLEGGN